MAGRSVDLLIRVVTDTKGAVSGMESAGKSASGMAGKLKSAALPAAAIGAGVLAFGVAAGKAASDTQQAMGAVDSVFKESAGQIKAWSDQSATSVGLSKTQYGELAAVMGAQLKNMGIPMDEVAGKTNDLITMGADLAATYGGSTADAVNALGSALRGETDPIEKYGISIKQADIAARQAKDGTKDLTGAAGKQAKTAALLALATEQAGGAMGQFARETDSAAGSQQIATAQWEDAQSALGTALLPAMSTMAGVLGTIAGLIKDHSTLFMVLVGVIGALAAAVLVANAAMSIYTVVTTIAASTTAMAWIAALWPILLVIAAIALVVGAIVLLWKKCAWFRNAVLAVWAAIQAAFKAVVGWLTSTWQSFINANMAAGAALRAFIIGVWNGIKAAAAAVVGWLKSAWAAVWAVLTAAAAPFVAAFTLAFRLIAAVARVVGDVLKQVWRVVFWAIQAGAIVVRNVVVSAFRAVMGPVKAAAAVVRSTWQAVFSALKSAVAVVKAVIIAAFRAVMAPISAAASSVRAVVTAAFRAISSVASSVASAVRSVWSSVFSALRSAASGMASALSGPFHLVESAVRSVIGAVESLIGWLGRIKVPKISLPKLPGLNSTTTVNQAPTVAGLGRAAPTAAPRAASAGLTIVIQGAIDPEATARQVRRILAAHDRRMGTSGAGLRTGLV